VDVVLEVVAVADRQPTDMVVLPDRLLRTPNESGP